MPSKVAVSGFGSEPVRSPCLFLALLVLMTLIFATRCGGGGEEQAQKPSATPGSTVGGQDGWKQGEGFERNYHRGSTVGSAAQAETLKDQPFKLNSQQLVPPNFRAAYQRKALIVVEFIKESQDASRGIEYPQGIGPDEKVD